VSAVVQAERFIYETLAFDTELMGLVQGVYRDAVPDGAQYPCVRFALYGNGRTLRDRGGRLLWSRLEFLVTVIGEGESRTGLEAAADRIEALLHRARAPQQGVLQVLKTLPLAFEERDGGQTWQHLGAVYEVLVGS